MSNYDFETGQSVTSHSTLVKASGVTAAEITSQDLPEGWVTRKWPEEDGKKYLTTADTLYIETDAPIISNENDTTAIIVIDELDKQIELVAASLRLLLSSQSVTTVMSLAMVLAKKENAEGIPTAAQQMVVDHMASKGIGITMRSDDGDVVKPPPSASALEDLFNRE